MTWSVWTMIHQTLIGLVKRALCLFLAGLLAGCTTTHLGLTYKQIDSTIPLSGDSVAGERLGFVTGESGGYGWSRCTARAEKSLDELVENAKALGADAVGNIWWDATGTEEPGCTRKWLYVILWPILATPMFMNTRVEGVAYKKAPSKKAER